MKTKLFVVLSVLALASLLAGAVAAQGPQPPAPPPMPPALQELPFAGPEGKPFGPWAAAPRVGVQSVGAASISLGQPGTVFRYVQTFGVTEEPYLEDNNHFYNVEGLGVDGNNIWLTDSRGARVLKFDANGNFLQKIGKAGVIDYTGTSLDYVTDVAVDSSGNIWVVDGSAAHVVKHDSSGNRVSELGQSWNRGSDNSHFNDPISIAFDGAGNIYVSDTGLWGNDYGNHRVQVFNSSGTYLATIGQTGVCGPGNDQFCGPRHIAVYGTYLYVADAGNHRVQIFDITNPSSPSYVATLGATGVSGSDNAHFDHPEGVGVDASYIYVADSNNNRVQIFNRTTQAYVATLGTGGGQGDYQFNHPTDVVVDASGNIYVADNWNKRVQQFNSLLVYQRTYGTTGVSYVTDGYHYYFPRGVAVAADGSIYIVEERGHRLVKLNAAGEPQWTVGEPGQAGSDNSHFFGPQDVAVDPSGRVYTVESWDNHRVQIFNPNGTYYATLGTGWGTGNYQFKNPTGITIDGAGNIYVADSGNHRVQIYNSQRTYVATLGETGVSGSDNAHFNWPTDVAVDASGTIYVADEGNDRVQVFNSNRQYVRTIGETGVSGDDFGHFASWGPHNLAVDSQNRLYVSDSGNTRVQVFDSSGAYLTTIGGRRGTGTSRFSHVKGIAVGPDGAVYAAEIFNNHRIQKFAPGVPGWKQVNINGFGDRRNLMVQALAPFNNYLYAGTINWSSGAQLWRMDTTGNWTSVMTNGFGNTANVGIDHLLEFNGNLYAGTRNSTNTPPYTQGGEIWRSSNGTNWTQVVSSGFGDPTNGEVMRLAAFNGQIYAGTWSYTDTHGAEIWRSITGNPADWQQVVSNGFGDVRNYAIMTLKEVNGYLYAGTASSGPNRDGADVWRTADGINWSPVVTNGFGYTGTVSVSSLEVFGGSLYAAINRAGDDFVSPLSPQIWRCPLTADCDAADDWEVVVSDGFGNSENRYFQSLSAFDGHLYVTVSNWATGIEIWRTSDGSSYERVVSEGFTGDAANLISVGRRLMRGGEMSSVNQGPDSLTIYNNRLYVPIRNWNNGGEVWMLLHRLFLPLVMRRYP